MKRFLFWLVVIAAVAGAGAAGYSRYYLSGSGTEGRYRTKPIDHGDVKLVVNSTGTVQPVLSVQVGAFVSGPIQKIFVNFNDKVQKDQILAEIDPRNYKAAVAHEEAALARSQADLRRVKALLEQAARNERRALSLQPKKAISGTDLDQCVAERKSLEAQVALAEAVIEECTANLATAKTNLDFTAIKSPVEGIIVDRKVDPGQTVAAQFQTPVMFVVAPDLETKVYVYASVDEADIGQIREAKTRGEPVTFTVDAYPKDVFEGKIAQVRLNPTTVSNVVTYTVVVEASNAQMKLLPGMTANLSFQIQTRTGVSRIPNGALRFRPKLEQVRPADRSIAEDAHNRQYVWIVEDDLLSAVEVTTGLSDKSFTELVSGDVQEGREVVVGTLASASKGGSSGQPPPPH